MINHPNISLLVAEFGIYWPYCSLEICCAQHFQKTRLPVCLPWFFEVWMRKRTDQLQRRIGSAFLQHKLCGPDIRSLRHARNERCKSSVNRLINRCAQRCFDGSFILPELPRTMTCEAAAFQPFFFLCTNHPCIRPSRIAHSERHFAILPLRHIPCSASPEPLPSEE